MDISRLQSHYLIKSFIVESRVNILKEIFTVLYENDIKFITFNSAATNLSIIKQLGDNIQNVDEESFLEHPVTKEPIVIVPDTCHMLKLTQNTMRY